MDFDESWYCNLQWRIMGESISVCFKRLLYKIPNNCFFKAAHMNDIIWSMYLKKGTAITENVRFSFMRLKFKFNCKENKRIIPLL
jgi:hypothetical protein